MRTFTHAAALILILLMASLHIFGEKCPYVWIRSPFGWGDHFSAVYHPTVQVALGRTILIDQASQYGLFPHFLAPIFALIGPGVLGFTLVMAALVAIVLAMIWAFLARGVGNRVVALIGLLAVIGNGSFILIEMKDVYFQYLPIRMVFPAASLWLCGRFLDAPSREILGDDDRAGVGDALEPGCGAAGDGIVVGRPVLSRMGRTGISAMRRPGCTATSLPALRRLPRASWRTRHLR